MHIRSLDKLKTFPPAVRVREKIVVLTLNRVGEILQGDHAVFLWKLPLVKAMQSLLNLYSSGR